MRRGARQRTVTLQRATALAAAGHGGRRAADPARGGAAVVTYGALVAD